MDTSARLSGKVAVITGGSSGIGLAIASRFAEAGAHVFITGRRQAELDAAVRRIGKNVTAVQGDLTKPSDLEKLYTRVQHEKGLIDVLVCNAGGGAFAPLGAITPDAFQEIFMLNAAGVLFTVQAALPLLSDGASLVIVGSVAGSKGLPGTTLYAAAKAAVRSFARVWTQELRERRIRVNVLSPGPVNTPAMQAAPEELRALLVKDVPMGRMAAPEEIAEVALFLGSDASSFVTGVELFADGGWAQV